jgi:dienelactone hydrolase
VTKAVRRGVTAFGSLKSILLISAILCASPRFSASQPSLEGRWTGGFMLQRNWVAVNLRFASQGDTLGDRADILFPSYGGGENVLNVPLENLKLTPEGIHFEIPVRAERLRFDTDRWWWMPHTLNVFPIFGTFGYGNATGTLGVNPWAYIPVDSLEKYYGAYRVSPDHVISILRGWGHPRTLNYVDYKTGQVGTLWPNPQGAFYSGSGLSVSYPITLKVTFDEEANGQVTGLSWKSWPQNRPNPGRVWTEEKIEVKKISARKLEVTEEQITCRNGDVNIGGTLILPEGTGRFPVVIVTPGDFGTNRNQLRLWAHNYVSRGIAAFVFDSRGAGASTGSVGANSFSDLANDVLASVQALKARPEIEPHAIGLFGFSNSAWTVSLAASRSSDVAFLILQSFVGVVPWKQEVFRAETQLRVDGFSEALVNKGADFMRQKFEVARTGEGWEQLQGIMQNAADERWVPYTNPPVSLERLRRNFGANMTYDPVPALETLRIPILALWGDKDTYLPVPETVAIFKEAMSKAGNKEYVAKVYPNCSHSLLVTKTGSPSTGGTETNFAAGVWDMQADWLLKHVGRP